MRIVMEDGKTRPSGAEKLSREEKLAAKLRENLRRRKAQARAVAGGVAGLGAGLGAGFGEEAGRGDDGPAHSPDAESATGKPPLAKSPPES